jgi:hypothetical protein
VYYTALLRSVGCTSDAHEQAGLFGDEIAARAELNLAPHLPARELLGVLVRHSAAGEPPLRRAAAFGRTLGGLPGPAATGRGRALRDGAAAERAAQPAGERLGGAARGVRALGRERVPGRPGRGRSPRWSRPGRMCWPPSRAARRRWTKPSWMRPARWPRISPT